MDVRICEHAGFCFGVKHAVDSVYELLESNSGRPIFTLGPIIHNEVVVKALEDEGVFAIKETDDLPADAIVVIRSHGVAESVINELMDRHIEVFDATCPFVKKIHDTVREHSMAGEQIVIIGNPVHPEVVGILGWSVNGGTVLETYEDVEDFKPENSDVSICVVAQTTFNSEKFQDFVEILIKREYNINVVDTICQATRIRQQESMALANQCDMMLVIGGAESSNTRKLYELCKMRCENTFYIQTADSLKNIDLNGAASLGITAGASTPNSIIQEVSEACQKK